MRFSVLLISLLLLSSLTLALKLGPNLILNPSFENDENYDTAPENFYNCGNYGSNYDGQWYLCSYNVRPQEGVTSVSATDGSNSYQFNISCGDTTCANLVYGNDTLVQASRTYRLSIDFYPVGVDVDYTGFFIISPDIVSIRFNNETATFENAASENDTVSVVDIGGGWKRVVLIFTTPAGTPSQNIGDFPPLLEAPQDFGHYYLIDNIKLQEIIPQNLAIKTAGELDYQQNENTRIRIATLVVDEDTKQPVTADINVTMNLYRPNGNLFLSNVRMVQKNKTGIYEFVSNATLATLQPPKGIYLVHITAIPLVGNAVHDIIEIHHDPPGEVPADPALVLIVMSIGLAIIVKRYH